MDLEYLEITAVAPMDSYCLDLTFSNGERRLFDMRPYLDKGVFRELKALDYFKQVAIDYGTTVWPNAQDMSPATLYLAGIQGHL